MTFGDQDQMPHLNKTQISQMQLIQSPLFPLAADLLNWAGIIAIVLLAGYAIKVLGPNHVHCLCQITQVKDSLVALAMGEFGLLFAPGVSCLKIKCFRQALSSSLVWAEDLTCA